MSRQPDPRTPVSTAHDRRTGETRILVRRFFDVDEAMSAARRRRLRWLAAHWLLRPIGYLELTVVYKIEFTTLPPLFEIPGYTIEHATADDIRELTRHSHRGEPPAVINSLWTEGHHCFVAKSGKRIVAYNWIAFGAVQEEEYRYEPDSNHAICVDAYTYPEHRGKKLHYLLLLTMLHFAAASGKSMAYTGASLFNVVSWKTHVRMGWRRAFTCCWFLYGSERQSYAELNAHCCQLANALSSRGIGRGDRVASLVNNCSQFIEIFFAAAKIGAVFAPINFRLAARKSAARRLSAKTSVSRREPGSSCVAVASRVGS
jgi:GNAT superfamily N-acetyltransferase